MTSERLGVPMVPTDERARLCQEVLATLDELSQHFSAMSPEEFDALMAAPAPVWCD